MKPLFRFTNLRSFSLGGGSWVKCDALEVYTHGGGSTTLAYRLPAGAAFDPEIISKFHWRHADKPVWQDECPIGRVLFGGAYILMIPRKGSFVRPDPWFGRKLPEDVAELVEAIVCDQRAIDSLEQSAEGMEGDLRETMDRAIATTRDRLSRNEKRLAAKEIKAC